MKKVSIMMITIDRFDVTPHVWKENLRNAKVDLPNDIELELLVCDNGSKDQRIKDYFLKEGLHYYRNNMKNEGVGKSFNQLYLRSTGEYLAILGNDIKNPPGWLAKAIDFHTRVKKPGIIGWNWFHQGTPELTIRDGVGAHFLNPIQDRVFGTWFMGRNIVEDLGLFYEGYAEYSMEDSDMNERVNRAGYNSFYLPFTKSSHLVHDVGQNTEYRKFKDKCMAINLPIFSKRVEGFKDGSLPLKTPLPEMRDPLT